MYAASLPVDGMRVVKCILPFRLIRRVEGILGLQKGYRRSSLGMNNRQFNTRARLRSNTVYSQDKAILLPDTFHVRLRLDQPVLCSMLALPRPIRTLQPYWKLLLECPVLGGVILPDHHSCANDVCPLISHSLPFHASQF